MRRSLHLVRPGANDNMNLLSHDLRCINKHFISSPKSKQNDSYRLNPEPFWRVHGSPDRALNRLALLCRFLLRREEERSSIYGEKMAESLEFSIASKFPKEYPFGPSDHLALIVLLVCSSVCHGTFANPASCFKTIEEACSFRVINRNFCPVLENRTLQNPMGNRVWLFQEGWTQRPHLH